ncbi:P-loop containing nucleoside triphosphate hydrolase protein [Mollisia scopiformis]|uniref:p-loop containing nucleoside triphosphate hydrolase protein n=1 Tax=Mollisia scopiformis TaxID=149040 RepID=A0A194X567_MOLSC|nr:P-loop containing nucleoside triphosphate hydrolase protein [Mollisia scopiformis]KUJ15323.1 P-loop containing nucleoside triphosphate hydrolase protein [Mollisia scopiformis]
MDDPPKVNILLLGDSEVGKSTFLGKGSSSHDPKTPIPRLRDHDQPFIFEIKFFNRPYRFSFYDTASPENWTLLTPDVIVLCYDISTRLSLINVQRIWVNEVKRLFTVSKELPVLLLGLKRDLRSEDDPNGIIYPQEGYRIAQEMRCDRYLECSAVTGELVHEVFEDICRTAAKSTKDEGGLSEGGCVAM